MDNQEKKFSKRIYCIQCHRITHHDLVAVDKQHFNHDNTPEMQIDFAAEEWRILKCRGCDERTFEESWFTSEDGEENTRLYPPRGEGTLTAKLYYSIPPNLQKLYRQIIDVFNGGGYFLCAAGLRIVIEGICKDKKVNDGEVTENGETKRKSNLQGKIEGLVEKGLLTRQHATSLHEHRFLGNEALHELQQPEAEDLKIAIEIIEHTLYNIYELGGRTELLRLRKKRPSE